MAKKEIKKLDKPKRKQLSERQKTALFIILLIFALYLLVAVIFYYFTWAADQNFVKWGSIATDEKIANPTGKFGAYMAHYVVGKWFGAFGVIIPLVLIVFAFRIRDIKPRALQKSVRISLLTMILGSLTLGFVFEQKWGVFGSGLGGEHGIFISKWIEGLVGGIGTGLFLVLGWVLLALYVNSQRTIKVMDSVGRGVYEGGKLVGAKMKRREARAGRKKGRKEGKKSKRVDVVAKKMSGEEVAKKIENVEVEQAEGESFTIVDTRSREDEQPHTRMEGDRAPTVNEIYREVIYEGLELDRKAETGIGARVMDSTHTDEAGDGQIDPTSGGYVPFEALPEDGANERVVPKSIIGGVGVSGDDGFEIVLAEGDEEVVEGGLETIYDPTRELSRYKRPELDLLEDHKVNVTVTEDEVRENKEQIERTLSNFGIEIDQIKATIGPTVTLYEIVPAAGVRISRIKNLEDDIALSLKALGIRIIAPMPGQGTIGIEVPNKDKEIVSMYSVIKTKKFQDSTFELPVALGRTIANELYMIDLAAMPHLLVAGATGQGKSVGLNAIITSLLYKKHPAELKFVMVDPKRVELSLYKRLEKHFLAKMESEDEAILTDTQKVVNTLNSLTVEMSRRYDLMGMAQVRKISEYNDKFKNRKLNPEKGHRFLPYIVVIIDEFADMIMTAGREVEAPVTRLAQLARAVGIHLVIATQRPDVKVITGLIKANFPARIAFRVTSMVDSRTILDQSGANQLIGRGDMLISINGELTRIQCAFIDTPEIAAITEFISKQTGYFSAYELPDYSPESENGTKDGEIGELDKIFEEVARFVVEQQQGSTSAIQRRFSIGYNRAGRITDQLQAMGIVGAVDGSKGRNVLITDVVSLEYILDKHKE